MRRDLRRLTATLGDDDFMNQITAELAGFTAPALLAWAGDDRFFPVEHARRGAPAGISGAVGIRIRRAAAPGPGGSIAPN